MTQLELENKLRASLSQVYDSDAVNSLAEFWEGELHVLEYMYLHSDSEINPSVLSDALTVSRARISTALSGLRKKGYITMEMCKNDRRKMRVMLTADGENYFKEKQQMVEKNFAVLVSGLGEKNVMELTRLIDLSVKIIDTDSDEQ